MSCVDVSYGYGWWFSKPRIQLAPRTTSLSQAHDDSIEERRGKQLPRLAP